MKCDQAGTWLLLGDSPEFPPPPVANHLQECRECRELQREILQLEQDVGAIPPLFASLPARQALLRELKQLPQTRANLPFRASWFTAIPIGLGSAIAVVAVLAFVGGRLSNRPGADAVNGIAVHSAPAVPTIDSEGREAEEQTPPTNSREDRALLDRLINNHIQLSVADDSVERFNLLAQLSNMLWSELLRQAESGPTMNLPKVSRLYQRVVSYALPRRAHSLSPESAEMLALLSEQLQHRSEQAGQLSGQIIPAAAEQLLSAGERSAVSAELIRAGSLPTDTEISGEFAVERHDWLTVVVERSIDLSEEEDPLVRARRSSDVADSLSAAIIFTSLEGEAKECEELGICLARVVDQSLMVNLENCELAQFDELQLAEFNDLKQAGKRAEEVLRRNLEKAPVAARKGLERALKAHEKSHRGPPWGRGGEKRDEEGTPPGRPGGFIPPGLRNREP